MSRPALEHLTTPAAVVDLTRAQANAALMIDFARRPGVTLRPHVKTHKCPEIGRFQAPEGKVTVSTLAEARAFLAAGFADITYAVPITPDKFASAADLVRGAYNFSVLADSVEIVSTLDDVAGWMRADATVPVFAKIDTGGGRAGVDPESDALMRLAEELTETECLSFAGLLTHAGQSYAESGQSLSPDAAKVTRSESPVSTSTV